MVSDIWNKVEEIYSVMSARFAFWEDDIFLKSVQWNLDFIYHDENTRAK